MGGASFFLRTGPWFDGVGSASGYLGISTGIGWKTLLRVVWWLKLTFSTVSAFSLNFDRPWSLPRNRVSLRKLQVPPDRGESQRLVTDLGRSGKGGLSSTNAVIYLWNKKFLLGSSPLSSFLMIVRLIWGSSSSSSWNNGELTYFLLF